MESDGLNKVFSGSSASSCANRGLNHDRENLEPKSQAGEDRKLGVRKSGLENCPAAGFFVERGEGVGAVYGFGSGAGLFFRSQTPPSEKLNQCPTRPTERQVFLKICIPG